MRLYLLSHCQKLINIILQFYFNLIFQFLACPSSSTHFILYIKLNKNIIMNNIIKGRLLLLLLVCVISLQTEGIFGEIDSESQEKISKDWQQNNQQQNDQTQEYIKQFAIAMTNFKPAESFNFKTRAGEELVFIYWPQNDIVQFRGIFYTTQGIENSDQQSDLTLICEINGQIIKNITNKKIGVYNFQVVPGSQIKLIFKSLKYNLGIYISYQFNKKHRQSQSIQQQKQTQNQNNETQTKAIYNRFKVVSEQMEQQQQILRQIITLSTKQYDTITNNMALLRIRVIIETIAVLLSGLVCLFFLKKKLQSGYQLLI